jgi:5-formyltetrahydrofolate cyclo-ligase
MSGYGIEETRNLLRQSASAQRDALTAVEWRRRSELIQARALELSVYRSAAAVALYYPLRNEVDTAVIRDHALASGKWLYYPKYEFGAYSLVRFTGTEHLARGHFGILEPTGSEYFPPAAITASVIFVPGVAFDRQGNRLGHGKGWYDRILAEVGEGAPAVGLAFGFQLVDRIAAQVWDRKMGFVISENQTIDCRVERRPSVTDAPVVGR